MGREACSIRPISILLSHLFWLEWMQIMQVTFKSNSYGIVLCFGILVWSPLYDAHHVFDEMPL